MHKKFFVLIALVAMVVGLTATVSAQDNGVQNFVFSQDAQWVEGTPRFYSVGGAVNVRAVPGTDANSPLFTLTPTVGSFVEVVASYSYPDGATWLLIRGWNELGAYQGAGWIYAGAALTELTPGNAPAVQDPGCEQVDGGTQLDVQIRFNTGWVDDTQANSCALFYEGRPDSLEIHQYWVIRDNNGSGEDATVETQSYLHHGFFWLLEGTGWVHPTTWNVGDGFADGETGLDREYPPMVALFAADKEQVMRDNGYEWPVRVNLLDGSSVDYEVGAFRSTSQVEGQGGGGGVDRCAFDSPQEMNVTGVFNGNTGVFTSASLGALDCRTLALWQTDEDEAWELQKWDGALERLTYVSVIGVWLVPSNWDDQDIARFARQQFSSLPTPYTVEVEDVFGLPQVIEG